jgi:hypothetical protein
MFLEQIFSLQDKKDLGNFGKMCFCIVNLTKFASLGAKFTNIFTSQI